MIDINEKINLALSKTFTSVFSGKVSTKTLNITTLILSVVVFITIIWGEFVFSSIFLLLSMITSTIAIKLSNDEEQFMLSSVSNLIKYIFIVLGTLTVVLNLELHQIALYLIIYLFIIGSISFISKEYLKALFTRGEIEKINPSCLLDSILITLLFISFIPFINKSVIIIYIIVSSILNSYFLVSYLTSFIKKKEISIKLEEKTENKEDENDN